MSRYIDIETINPRQYENSEVELGVLAYDYDEVDAMPFLDIVRCKECKWKTEYNSCDLNCRIDYLDGTENDLWFYVNDDDFCSYGERKESE